MSVAIDHPPASEVTEVLRHILESQPFKTSKQCQDLLQFVVDRSLKGDDASLRERIIGMEVFGRQANYSTSDDPVVRIRAADVRKRLAQYYQSLPAGLPTIHIELPAGSYRAYFRSDPPLEPSLFQAKPIVEHAPQGSDLQLIDHRPTTAPQEHSSLLSISHKRLMYALCVLATAAMIGWIVWQRPSPQQEFWSAVADKNQPLLFYVGSNTTYQLSSQYLTKYRADHGIANTGLDFPVNFPPDSSIPASDLVSVHDTYVTTGDLAAAVQLVTMMKEWNRPFMLRSGRDLSFGDMRSRPSVMIGAFNNPWAVEFTKDLPYSFRQGDRIQSRDNPEKSWAVQDLNSSAADDYALISRLLISKSGGPLITVGGIGQFGTQAAGEFLANPDRMRDLLVSAPKGWQKMNMQAVLRIKVVGYTPVAVDVVATKYW